MSCPGGDIYYCGENQWGQFGDGSPTAYRAKSPRRLVTGPFVQIAAGESHLIGLRSDGTVYAWGLNNYGQSGAADTTRSKRVGTVSIPASAGLRVLDIGAGYLHSYATLCRTSGGSDVLLSGLDLVAAVEPDSQVWTRSRRGCKLGRFM